MHAMFEYGMITQIGYFAKFVATNPLRLSSLTSKANLKFGNEFQEICPNCSSMNLIILMANLLWTGQRREVMVWYQGTSLNKIRHFFDQKLTTLYLQQYRRTIIIDQIFRNTPPWCELGPRTLKGTQIQMRENWVSSRVFSLRMQRHKPNARIGRSRYICPSTHVSGTSSRSSMSTLQTKRVHFPIIGSI